MANYSGITEADYERLPQIAPTVAYPDEPWSTPWRDVITTVGEALGKADQATELEDLGFTTAPSVGELDTGESSFFYTLSLEEVDRLTSDVLLSYSATDERAAEIAADPALQAMGQFQGGTVATVVGESMISSVSPPTALSVTWGLDDFVAELTAAVAEAGR